MENTVNERIKNVISELNMTKNAFADKLNVAGSVIYNIVKGKNKPSYDLLEKMITVFGINSEYLLKGKGDMFFNNDVSSHPINEKNHEIKNDDNDNLVLESYLGLLFKMMKISEHEKKINNYEDILIKIDIISEYLTHYGPIYKMENVFKKYKKKEISIDLVQKEFKEVIAVEMELLGIIKPYEKTIIELYEKISSFDQAHDNKYNLI